MLHVLLLLDSFIQAVRLSAAHIVLPVRIIVPIRAAGRDTYMQKAAVALHTRSHTTSCTTPLLSLPLSGTRHDFMSPLFSPSPSGFCSHRPFQVQIATFISPLCSLHPCRHTLQHTSTCFALFFTHRAHAATYKSLKASLRGQQAHIVHRSQPCSCCPPSGTCRHLPLTNKFHPFRHTSRPTGSETLLRGQQAQVMHRSHLCSCCPLSGTRRHLHLTKDFTAPFQAHVATYKALKALPGGQQAQIGLVNHHISFVAGGNDKLHTAASWVTC